MSPTEKPHCRIVYTKPSIENVISYAQYRRTQPEYQDPDQQQHLNIPNDSVVLLGGGRDLAISLLNEGTPSVSEIDPKTLVDLFILNSCIIIWFNSANQGICISYPSVLYHAARRLYDREEGHRLELLLTIERDPIIDGVVSSLGTSMAMSGEGTQGEDKLDLFTLKSVELLLTPRYSMYERHYNSEIENLFTFMDFGLNRGDAMVNNCNEALAMALELSDNYNSADDDSSDMEAGENVMDDTRACTTGMNVALEALSSYSYQNYGYADDLNDS